VNGKLGIGVKVIGTEALSLAEAPDRS